MLGRLGGYGMVAFGAYLFLARGSHVSGLWLAFIGFFLASAARSAEESAVFSGRIEHILVADVMDEEPVAIREDAPVAEAERAYFLRYGWPWFPVVDSSARLVGVVSGRPSRACPARSGRPGRSAP